jgi:transposase-like protein
MSVPTLAETLGQLDQTPPAPSTPEEKKRAELSDLNDEEKRAQAYAWKLQGQSTEVIARAFGIDSRTIRRWFLRTESDFREQFETQTAANIMSESLLFLGNIEEMAMYEANQSAGDEQEYDLKSRKVKTPKEVERNAKHITAKMLVVALKARGMKLDLLLETGVLPKDPGRLYRTMEKEGNFEQSAHSKSSRTADQIRDDMLKLAEETKLV